MSVLKTAQNEPFATADSTAAPYTKDIVGFAWDAWDDGAAGVGQFVFKSNALPTDSTDRHPNYVQVERTDRPPPK